MSGKLFINSGLILFLTFIFLNTESSAQSRKNYIAQWKRIDSLYFNKGLTKSALAEVEKIYTEAKKEDNQPQLIKALIYKTGLQQATEENSLLKGIAATEKEITLAKEPVKSILQSILAEYYWTYLQQNRYKFYNRTNTVNFDKADVATWDIDDFHKKITSLHLGVIEYQEPLSKVNLSAFDPIIIKGNSRHLRPTLYDLLAHRALNYFSNNERTINKPAFAFELDDRKLFAQAQDFVNQRFSSRDSLSQHLHALGVYQSLTRLHLSDRDPAALIDLEIDRFQFLNLHGIMEDKDSLYQSALERLVQKYPDHKESAQAWYLIAQLHANRARSYDPLKDTANRFAFLEARRIAEMIIKQKDSSEGRSNAETLLKDILRQELNLYTERVNLPAQPFRMFVQYRNISQLNFRLVKVNKDILNSIGNDTWREEYWAALLKLPAIRAFAQTLPATGDHQKHGVEMKIDALPVGEYAIISSPGTGFNQASGLLGVEFFHVSSLSYINSGSDYFALNRETGQPLKKITAKIYSRQYDYEKRKYTYNLKETLTTNNDGYFRISPLKGKDYGREIQVELIAGNDQLFVKEGAHDYYRGQEDSDDEDLDAEEIEEFEEDRTRVYFFTDRSIYRPGQTIFFKGIVVTTDYHTRKSKIIPQFKTTIYLNDANGEKADSIKVTTNEFGSYNGKFRLPENRLNGEFTITDVKAEGQANFSVEEYKRPKFEVKYEPLKVSYRILDTITVTGIAKAYAGNNIDGAQVKYRVVRQARFPYPWMMWKRGWYPVEEQEITNGEVKSGTDGKFTIRFAAIPDKKIPRTYEPVFDYKVIADVTDINGETRTGETIVSVGYKSILIDLRFPQPTMRADSLQQLIITTRNLAGEHQPTNLNITAWRLDAPNRLIRNRYWQQPDQFILTKEEYLQSFPYDEYSDESKKESWKRLEKGFDINDSSRANGILKISNRLSPGWYAIEVTATDKYGAIVKDIEYVQLTNQQGEPVSPDYNWIESSQQTKEPGETAIVEVGSSADNLHLIRVVDSSQSYARPVSNQKKTLQYSISSLNKELKRFEFPIKESNRGGIKIIHAFIKHNRVFLSATSIDVPWSNKELSINYETYRDKTLPGSEEKWKVKLTGYRNEKVAAEILTSMYDASLDQFKPQSWTVPALWPSNSNNFFFNGQTNFTFNQSAEKYPDEKYTPQYHKSYDQLINLIDLRGRREFRNASLKGKVSGIAVEQSAQANGDALQEVVVVGYGMQSKRALTDSVVTIRGNSSLPENALIVVDGVIYEGNINSIDPDDIESITILKGAEAIAKYGPKAANGVIIITTKTGAKKDEQVQVRKNFNETAFFFPDLRTDTSGSIEFSFQMPESLTEWKWMTMSHTKDLAFGYGERTIITQKELMVQPNLPRFLREGDRMDLTTKIVNLSDTEMTGYVELQLLDATNNQPVDGWFQNMYPNQYFTAGSKQSTAIQFSIQVPFQFNKPVIIRFIARSGKLSDGEENPLPVISNKVLVTETLPINFRGTGTKTLKMDKLVNSANSETLSHHAVTVEYTSNPAWYAVQAIPYLMEFPYECAEQTWNRFYGNALATKIVNASPRIKAIIEKWKTVDTAALQSNLEKNQELKSVLLQETPWVLEAKSETEQKKRIALLFDLVRMSNELEKNLDQLIQMQSSNGGFVWFKGGPDDRYMTQYIVSGIGHLIKLNAIPTKLQGKINQIVSSALPYLDNRIKDDYDRMVKLKADLTKQQPDYIQIHYLYTRSFFNEKNVAGNVFKAYNYFRQQAQKFWLQQSRYMQGMTALALFRTGDGKTPNDILRSMKQNAIQHEELGMYWKDITGGYYWYQAPIETQSLLIEAFGTITKDITSVDAMKTWLLKNKQTSNWRTTKATAEACYALLLQGTDWLSNSPVVEIKLGDKTVRSTEQAEAGTGYFKKTFDAPFVNPGMGNISVSVTQPSSSSTSTASKPTSWGAVYWQYFENAENVTVSTNTPLKLIKKVFLNRNTDRGPVLEPIGDNVQLKTGDKVTIRIELRVDRNMEYVHMKDMRAAALEPVNVLSSFKWQGGLGYYESTKDASTNFFFGFLPKGTHVFEYTLFATQTGSFSNGITSIQCMYAPEFASHSEGIKIQVE